MPKVMNGAAPVDVPKLEDFPEYVEAYELLGQFKARRDELVVEINQAQTAVEAEKKTDAERVLAGESLDEIIVNREPSKLGDLLRKQRAIREAIEIQERRLRAVVSECSREACERVLPEFRELAGRAMRLTRELAQTNDQMRAVTDALEEQGFSWGSWLWPVWTYTVGSSRDEWSRANYFLRECAEHGVVET